MSLLIRLMQKKDLLPLAKIYVRVYDNFNVGEKWNENAAQQFLFYCFQRQPDLSLVAVADKRVVGAFFADVKPWCDGNHLVDGELFVDPEYQRQGIGTALQIVMYKKAIKKYNAKVAEGITFRDKPFPLSWYKHLGFKEVKNRVIIQGNLSKALNLLKKK
ncbi:GNAT family N-acetyltransferase [Candidatus Woesearchaeota archaeon]|nr:GNAT family N-acetyltransferase [Candidatus Woesearchaeota archaeon]